MFVVERKMYQGKESERNKETYVVDTASSSMSRILTITDGKCREAGEETKS